MSQRLPLTVPAPDRDPAHPRRPFGRFAFFLPVLGLLLLSHPTRLAAQASGTLQASAQVLPVQVSVGALGLVAEALKADSSHAVLRSALAQVRVEAEGRRERPRVVRVDFLRN
jgi:hypothetical protein